ncbi:hypothetical protein D3C76_1328890 [compost metagenome]
MLNPSVRMTWPAVFAFGNSPVDDIVIKDARSIYFNVEKFLEVGKLLMAEYSVPRNLIELVFSDVVSSSLKVRHRLFSPEKSVVNKVFKFIFGIRYPSLHNPSKNLSHITMTFGGVNVSQI